MLSEQEKTKIRSFVSDQLRGQEDLSSLTLGILKKRYLLNTNRDSLSSEVKSFMKHVVGEELMKMEESDDKSEEEERERPRNKRKREEEEEEEGSGEEMSGRKAETGSRAKKLHREPDSSSESGDKKDRRAEREEKEDPGSDPEEEEEEEEVKKSEEKVNGSGEPPSDSSEEEMNESEKKKESESEESDRPEETEGKKENTSEKRKTGRREEEEEEEEKEEESDSESEEKRPAPEEKKNQNSESSSLSSSSSSSEEEKGNKEDDKKRKERKKEKDTRGQRDQQKTLTRLKRYIALCGVRLNYKKLLDGVVSVRSQVAVLKKELEKLGVHGRPTVAKCKKVRLVREEAQELAELDTKNIITTEGRPKRRGAWQKAESPPASPHVRALNSSSDSDEEKSKRGEGRRARDWANLKGIISDDADDSD